MQKKHDHTQISSATDIVLCHFRSFFALLPNYWPQKLKLGKNVKTTRRHHPFIVSSPLGSGGDDFCVISQAGGQLLNFKSQGGDTFRGEMILGSQPGGETALSWRIVGISTKCFTLNFMNFAYGTILYFSKFFTTYHTVYGSINICYIIMYKAKETPYTISWLKKLYNLEGIFVLISFWLYIKP